MKRPEETGKQTGPPLDCKSAQAHRALCDLSLGVKWVREWKQIPAIFCFLFKTLVPNLNRQVKLSTFSSNLYTFGRGLCTATRCFITELMLFSLREEPWRFKPHVDFVLTLTPLSPHVCGCFATKLVRCEKVNNAMKA